MGTPEIKLSEIKTPDLKPILITTEIKKPKVDTPEIEIPELPSVDSTISVKPGDLDFKKPEIKVKSKSKGLSCFGKPKGADLDGEYKASANIELDAPEGDISANIPC